MLIRIVFALLFCAVTPAKAENIGTNSHDSAVLQYRFICYTRDGYGYSFWGAHNYYNQAYYLAGYACQSYSGWPYSCYHIGCRQYW